MGKFKEITREDKNTKKWVEPRSFLLQANPPLESTYPIIIDNISLSYNLVEHFVISSVGWV
jgi:hypothetical protein